MTIDRRFSDVRSLEQLERRLLLSAVGFVTHELAPYDLVTPYLLVPFDVDRDGDIDLLSEARDHREVNLVWFENVDGQGTFGP